MPDGSGPAATRRGWFKSSRSNGGCACVEVLLDRLPTILIRDSKFRRDPSNHAAPEPTIAIEANQWVAFLAEVTGELVAQTNRAIAVEHDVDGTTSLRSEADGTTLVYTADEWVAFVAGIRAGEFRLPEPANV
jgi:hypothetical protein